MKINKNTLIIISRNSSGTFSLTAQIYLPLLLPFTASSPATCKNTAH
jgi:hypothetical protein